MKKPRSYSIWAGMLQRCFNSNNPDFPSYGGRGIKVDYLWRKYDNFLIDMGEPSKGKSLGRIDNNGGYSKANCRWETPLQQAMNRKNSRICPGVLFTVDKQYSVSFKGKYIKAFKDYFEAVCLRKSLEIRSLS